MSVPTNVYAAAVRLWLGAQRDGDRAACCEWCAATFGTLPVGGEKLALWVLTWHAHCRCETEGRP